MTSAPLPAVLLTGSRTPMARRPVPRSFRIVNALVALFFLVGAGIYVRAWLGLRALRQYQADPNEAMFAGMARFNHFWELSRVGIWVMIAAGILAVMTAGVAAVVLRASPGEGEASSAERKESAES